ncbi:hypothetical protein C7B65_14160 [Phormidesmis priestleyi ULC007]|uniref:Type II secretion system protein GspC N-terminal domain-containing protein n=1 Tax=Phormidesmis priestleyi ULC007 TaxID=1920490 RepID=A0A2T1DDX9_9CYAN|nr:type II secretion system protein N [Phormidesmis priestleyi]PSB18667.1 hypothetical protein C7B65_14160 [Phormidesmis priestleyi ULC007]PZO51572.1 MAG: hypothetical protein DCF14_08710 [Phormidesmis priestleyi]
MTQPVTNSKPLLDPIQNDSWNSEANTLPEPFLVESYADRLMDDLFGDVDRLLDGAVPPSEPVRVEAPAPKPKLNLAPPPLSSGLLAHPQWQSHPESAHHSLPDLGELANTQPPAPRSSGFTRFLMITGCTSAVAALAVWLVTSGMASRFVTALTQPPETVAPTTIAQTPPIDTNAQFSDYVQRSLEAIDRRATTGKSEGLPTAPYNSGLPTVPVPANQPPLRSSVTLPKASPLVITVPQAPTPIDPSRRELNQILVRLASVLERLSPTANRPAALQPPATSIPQVSPAPIGPQRTLVGVLESSDPSRSAALFEINGITQRYYVGESIGSSGWSLVEVSKQYVTVRRNGEVRTISAGQKL